MMNQRQRRKNQRRRKDSRKFGKSAYASQDGKCHWCGAEIVIARSFPVAERVSIRNGILHLRDGRRLLVATVDHVGFHANRMLADRYSATARTDVVMACSPCNSARANKPDFRDWLEKRKADVASQGNGSIP